MPQHAFSFLRLPVLPSKPRPRGLFIGSDRGVPLAVQAGLLDDHSDLIDVAKLSDHAGLASRYSKKYLIKKIELYRRYSIDTFIGGLLFEIAVLQKKTDEYLNTMKELGFTGVEVSEDTIPEMPKSQRAKIIKKAIDLGFHVYTEVGRKYPDKPMTVEQAIADIKADFEAGSYSVTVEASETEALKDTNPQVIVDIAKAIGLEKIVFECEPPSPWNQMAVWLINTLGPGVNLENIPIDECVKVYAMRQAMTRDTGIAFLTVKKGQVE